MASEVTRWWDLKPKDLKNDDFTVCAEDPCRISIQTASQQYFDGSMIPAISTSTIRLTGTPKNFAALGRWLTDTFYDPEGEDA